MANIVDAILDGLDTFLAWGGTALKQTTAAYCDVQTADSPTVLVSHDGSLLSVIRLSGAKTIVGNTEFDYIHDGLRQSLQTVMGQQGHLIQMVFSYNRDEVREHLSDILEPAEETARNLDLQLEDLFKERVDYLSQYCAYEEVYLVLWTKVHSLTREQNKRAFKDKKKMIAQQKIPPFRQTQNILAAIPDLRESHDAFIRSFLADLGTWGLVANLLEVHEAIYVMRRSADPEFTDRAWLPSLPGDKIAVKELSGIKGEISDILWPQLAKQILPRDAMNVDLRTARVGDRIYGTVFIDLFPKEVKNFARLLSRLLEAQIPWRISFLLESDGMSSFRLRSALSSVLSFTSSQNRLINDSLNLLEYINTNGNDAVVKLRVAAVTWAPENDTRLLRARVALLARAIEGWGSCDVSEVSGDAYEGVVSTMVGVSGESVAVPSIAPLSDVLLMMPFFRPSSPWPTGAVLFRSPSGKPLPYQPGSSQQTTWIDLFYARPGSGKSVLSNSINLAVCLAPGLQRLPRIAIIDIGPSSSGLILLLKDALPADKKHLAAYHRLRMRADYAINPFDTQLGCRFPTPTERSFLVNFITLLATPVSAERSYDGVADMAGIVVDELYKSLSDESNPNVYAAGVEEIIDGILEEIGFVSDPQTTWWEVTDALFVAGFAHEAMLAQRHTAPVLADVAAICRIPAIQDLYGKIIVPTGEQLIQAFSRMISGAVREYPIISQITQFDLGEARIVSLDLDEVARTGGEAANRQTAVMYMLARYVLARHYFLVEDNVSDMPELYRSYHQTRIREIREDPKRIVFDEFHRTSKAASVREQVIQDMREGRKWKVQIALLSQSLEDFDSVMVEFATSIFIMDAGPEQAIRRTAQVFGLSESAQVALKTRVHGPREGGATFLAEFFTKDGLNSQLLTSTLGPVELWALNTNAEDANLRNQLYKKIGPKAARQILSTKFPSGSALKVLEERYNSFREEGDLKALDDQAKQSVMDRLVEEIVDEYNRLRL